MADVDGDGQLELLVGGSTAKLRDSRYFETVASTAINGWDGKSRSNGSPTPSQRRWLPTTLTRTAGWTSRWPLRRTSLFTRAKAMERLAIPCTTCSRLAAAPWLRATWMATVIRT